MLKIYFGHLDEAVNHPAVLFNNSFEVEWFEDPFVKKICKIVDDTEVVSAYQMTNPVFGPVNCRILSQGCKNCILAYRTNNIINADLMGDNCAQVIVEIAREKDLIITLEHCFCFKDITDFSALILNSNKMVYTYAEYLNEVIEYL